MVVPIIDLEVCIFYVVTFYRKQPLCISGFSPGTLRQYSSGSDGGLALRSHIPETGCWLVSCPRLYETLGTGIRGSLPRRSVASTFLISHYLSFPGETRDVTHYLKMIWGTGQGGVGAEFSFQSWKEVWYLCCWVWSTKEPVSLVDVPESPGVSKYPAPLTNTASFLPACHGWKGTV